MERDLEYSDSRGQTGNFNSHAHVERDVKCIAFISQDSYFNSHAHVERDIVVLQLVLITKISTHTLTWSVTAQCSRGHTNSCNFNSHAHVERDS